MLEQLSDEELTALQREQQHALDVIRSQNIVTVTRRGRSLPVQRQANPEFTTLEGLHKRSQLTLNDELYKVFSLLWALPDLEKTKDGNQLTKAGYFKIMRALHSALQPKLTRRAQLDKTIAKDYEEDLAKFGELNKQNFCSSLFELVDMWCNSLESEQYAAFAWALVVNLVDPTTGTLRNGKIRCVFDTTDAALLALWREDNRNRRLDALRADILLRIPEVVARLQSRKKARVLSAVDVRQLKAMSKKMGLEFGNGEQQQQTQRQRYTFLENPRTPQTKTTTDASSEVLSESSPPSSPEPWTDTAARSCLDCVSATDFYESEALSPHTSVSSVPRSIQQQFCPAIVITHTRRVATVNTGREVEILHCPDQPSSRAANTGASARRRVSRPATTKPRNQQRGGQGKDADLYILQRLHPTSKRPVPQMPRAVSAPAGALRLGPTRPLIEGATSRSEPKLAGDARQRSLSNGGETRTQLPSSLGYYYSQQQQQQQQQQQRTLIETEANEQPANAAELQGQLANNPLLTRSWAWMKVQPGGQRPTPIVVEEESAAAGGDDAEDFGEAFPGPRLRSQSAPALCETSTSELVGHAMFSTECKDIPQRRRRALPRRKRKARSVIDPAAAAERVAQQQLALEQWYRSKEFRRLY